MDSQRSRRQPSWDLKVCLLASVVLAGMATGAVAQATDPDLAGALWLGGNLGAKKFDYFSTAGPETRDVPAVSAIAIDPGHKTVWAYAAPRLYALDYLGQTLFSVAVAETGSPADLVVNRDDGSVWLGLGAKLISFSAAGQRLSTITLSTSIVKLAFTYPATLWVATTGSVTARDPISGAVLAQLSDLGKGAKIKDVSGYESALWVGLGSSLRQYSVGTLGTTSFVRSWSISGLLQVEGGAAGSAWVVTGSDVRHCFGAGEMTVLPYPFAFNTEVVTELAQDSDGTAWLVGSEGAIVRSGSSHSYPFDSNTWSFRDVAILPRELTPPVVSFTSPVENGWVNSKPTLLLALSDAGSGINPSTVSVSGGAAGFTTATTCASTAQTASCVPTLTLPNSTVTFSANVSDKAGNRAAGATLHVRVDANPPTISFNTPANGSSTDNARLPLEVAFSDAQSGVVPSSVAFLANGAALPTACSYTAASAFCTPTTNLPDGPVTLTATVGDAVGNRSPAAQVDIVIASGPRPPDLVFTAPRPERTLRTLRPRLRLSWKSYQSPAVPASLVVQHDGANVTADCAMEATEANCLVVAPLPKGPVTLTATIRDAAGNLSSPAEVSFRVAPDGFTVSGRVVREDGSSASGAQVWISDDSSAHAVAESDGSFTISGVATQQRSLTVAARLGEGDGGFAGSSSAIAVVPGADLDGGTITVRPQCGLVFGDEFGWQVLKTYDYIESAAVFDDGSGPALYASGYFTAIGGVPARSIAKWDGHAWFPLANGLDSWARAMVVFNDGSGPALFVDNGASVGKWNGTQWTWLPSLDGSVKSLVVFDDGSGPALYAAGTFSKAGGISAKGLARWDGASWTAVGGWNASLTVAGVFNDGARDQLIVGGDFPAAPGRSQSIASWDGQRWSPLGTGLDATFSWHASPLALATLDDGQQRRLVVGGSFPGAGGLSSPNIVMWDGTQWTTMGGGLSNSVVSLVVHDDGAGQALYAAGSFSGGAAKWHDGVWTVLGGGLDQSVNTQVVLKDPTGFGSALLFGGDFDAANGSPSPGLALWHRDCSPPDRTPPRISLSSPAAASVTNVSSVTLRGSISEAATLTANNNPVAVNADRSFSYGPVTLVAGPNLVDFVATDGNGNRGSLRAQIILDPTPPVLGFSSPLPGSAVRQVRPKLVLSHLDAVGVDTTTLTVQRAGLPVPVTCQSEYASSICTPTASLPTGSVTLTATVRDLAGNTSNVAQLSFTIDPNTGPAPTTVQGKVTLVGGVAAAGAEVFIQGQDSPRVISGSDGGFAIAGVEVVTGQQLTVVARSQSGKILLQGARSALTPVAGGTTDAGTLVLRPLCPVQVDASFAPGVGVDGLYPDEYSDGSDTYLEPRVQAMAVYDDGHGPALYVGGHFERAGSISARNIAKWDGSKWSQVGGVGGDGGGTNGDIQTMVVYNGALYVGGWFTSAGSLPVRRLAKWNGVSWSDVGGGVTGNISNNSVYALAVNGSDLYVGGSFGLVGPYGSEIPGQNVAKWNGTQWSALGSGVGTTFETVYSLAVYGQKKELYVGGNFAVAGGKVVNHLAKWSGSSWSSVGGGVGPVDVGVVGVYSMAVHQGSLFVGGVFGTTGPETVTGYASVARWDGTKWSKVVGGDLHVWGYDLLDTQGVQSLLSWNDGTGDALYAVGSLGFLPIGGTVTDVQSIAKWNGTKWSSVGGGMPAGNDWGGMALAAFDPVPGDAVPAKLYVGNGSRIAGQDWLGVNGVGSWDGKRWSALGEGPSHFAQELAVFDTSRGAALHIAGSYATTPMTTQGGPFSRLPSINGDVHALRPLTFDGQSRLVAGGRFTRAGGWDAGSIASWNGKSWEPLGKGFDEQPYYARTAGVTQIEVADFGSGPQLYAAGPLTSSGGQPIGQVARWTGTEWVSVGAGPSDGPAGTIYGLAAYASQGKPALVVGGSFGRVGAAPISHLAAWDGKSWGPLGGSPDDYVTSLLVFDDGGGSQLYAGGVFTKIAGQAIPYLARWNGTGWSSVGTPPDGSISGLWIADDGSGPALFAMGGFTTIGGVPAQRFAKWDGTRWSAVPNNVSGYYYHSLRGNSGFAVKSLWDDDGPKVYFGGEFRMNGRMTEPDYLWRLHRPLECGLDDTTKPTLSIVDPTGGSWRTSRTPSVSLTFADDRSGVDTSSLRVTANGAQVEFSCVFSADQSSCTPATPLTEGGIVLSATIRDAAGNESAPASVAFSIDATAPSAAFSAPPAGGYRTRRPALALLFSDAGSGIDPNRLSLAIDGRETDFSCLTVAGGAACTATSDLPDGPATARFTARDLAGNASAEAVVSFTVESGLPSVSFSKPAAGELVSTAQPEIGLVYGDAQSGIDTTSLILQANGSPLAVDCQFAPASAVCIPRTPLSQGSAVLTATLRDLAGNASAVAEVAFAVDSRGPQISLTSPAGAPTRLPSVVFEGSLDEAGTLTINGESVEVSIDRLFSHVMPLAEGANAFHLVATDGSGNSVSLDREIRRDTVPPELSFTRPLQGQGCPAAGETLLLAWADAGSGIDSATLALSVNGATMALSCQFTPSSAACAVDRLPDGAVSLVARVADAAGNISSAAGVNCAVGSTGLVPVVRVTSPANGATVSWESVTILGEVSEVAALTVNGSAVPLAGDGSFAAGPFSLVEGPNAFFFEARDGDGGVGSLAYVVHRDSAAPAAVVMTLVSLSEAEPGRIVVNGGAGAVPVVESGERVVIENRATRQSDDFLVAPDGSFSGTVTAFDGDSLRLVVRDEGGNRSAAGEVRVVGSRPIPADPASAAPPLAPSMSVGLCDLVGFLWQGEARVQYGVVAEAVDCAGLALVRGRVLAQDGVPLAGVRVEAFGAPAMGATFTRSDGAYDLALPASSQAVVRLSRPGFLGAQRTLWLRPQQFLTLDDIVLVEPDSEVTSIASGVAAPQVARGSRVADAKGPRQTTLLFPSGTTAVVREEAGGTVSPDSIAVRATEYSAVGSGKASWPATLAPGMRYGYAVDLSVDGPSGSDAHVEFSRPLALYVEDFLGLPVGSGLLGGVYDPGSAAWLPTAKGLIVQVLSIADGRAELDVTGGGQAASQEELANLGVDDEERRQVAVLYSVGQRLLRAPVRHFSEYAYGWNNPRVIPVPVNAPPSVGSEEVLDRPAVTAFAGAVDAENQILGQSLPLRGTPFSLHYQSDRVPGRTAPYTLKIPLLGETVDPAIRRVDLTIDIAGQHVTRSFAPAPHLADEFIWDRREGYGREIQGAAPWTARIRYTDGSGDLDELVAERTFSSNLGTMDARGAAGLGGWTLSAQHFWDAATETLYYGDGRRQALGSEVNSSPALQLVAGTGEEGSTGDGGPARRARLEFPYGLSVTADGGLLIADPEACRVRKVSKTGVIETVAGTVCRDPLAESGDGGPAIRATLRGPMKAVEARDGSIYVVEYDAHRIRKIDREGTIRTVVGDGFAGCTGNELAFPKDIAVAADGSLLIANVGLMQGQQLTCSSIQALRLTGELETIVGHEMYPDGDPSHMVPNNEPEGVAIAPDGSIYFSDLNAVARRPAGGGLDPQHSGWIVAGRPFYYGGAKGWGEPDRYDPASPMRHVAAGISTLPVTLSDCTDPTYCRGDGRKASFDNTRFFRTGSLAIGPDGTVYVVDKLNYRVREIGPSEIVQTKVGGGSTLPSGDGLAARQVLLSDPTGVAVDPSGKFLFLADGALRQVWRVRLPGAAGELVVPEPDGSVRYVFDGQGRHLRTEDAVSGRVLLRFTYADFARPGGQVARLVTRVEDVHSNVVTIDRDSQGRGLAVVGPFGQSTTLASEPSTGYLSTVSSAGETVQLTHGPGGLLESLVDPRSGTYSFRYDSKGRLTQVSDPASGLLDLSREGSGIAWSVSEKTGLERRQTMETYLPSRDPDVPSPIQPEERSVRRFIDTAGLVTEVHERKDLSTVSVSPDGMLTTTRLVPDQLLGDLAPYVEEVTVETPSGLRYVVNAQVDKVPVTKGSQNAVALFASSISNGRRAEVKYQAGSRSVTATSPEGRLSLSRLDSFDRVIETSVSGLEAARTTYDEHGRVREIAQGPAGSERRTSWTYDSQGHVETITDPLQRTVRLEHDAAGRVTKQILPDLREISFSYDANGNLTSLTPPSRPAHGFSYTPVDQVDTYSPPDVVAGDDATHYTYNVDHQLELVARPDGQTIDPSYDAAGRLANVVTPTGATAYSYSTATGQLQSVSAPAGGGTTSYSYDGALVTQISQSGAVPASIGYTYDSNFEIVSRSINGDGATRVDYQYDQDGLVTQAGPLRIHRDATNGLVTGTSLLKTGDLIERNSFGEVVHYQSGFDDGTCTPTAPPFAGCTIVLDQTFVRDAVGRITQKTETLRNPITHAAETHTYIYTFDPSGRLTEVKRDGTVWETYGYDANSNRTSWTDPWGTGAATYDAQDRLLTYGNNSYTYTANGELLTKTQGSATVRYEYDVQGNLRKVTLADGTVIEYLIDAANRRIGKKINGTLVQGFIYGSGIAPLAETNGSGAVVSTFTYGTHGNVPDVMVRGGQTYRFVTDHLGSVRWVVNAETGLVAQRIDYDVFGRVTLDTASGYQPFGFAGGFYEDRTELVRFGARDYLAEAGRWTAKDPIGFGGGDSSLYGYVLAEPVNGADPSGHCLGDDWKCTQMFVSAYVGNIVRDRHIWSTGISFIPVVETVKDIQEAATGWDAVAGEPVTGIGRGATYVAAALPFLPGKAMRELGGGAAAARRGFRRDLAALTELLPEWAHAHHMFPVKFRRQFAEAGIVIGDARYGAWWEATEHLANARGYNEAWEGFLVTNPNREQILEFGRTLAGQYGLKIHF